MLIWKCLSCLLLTVISVDSRLHPRPDLKIHLPEVTKHELQGFTLHLLSSYSLFNHYQQYESSKEAALVVFVLRTEAAEQNTPTSQLGAQGGGSGRRHPGSA